MEINLAMLTYINDRVSNYHEANANFEISLHVFQRQLPKRHKAIT